MEALKEQLRERTPKSLPLGRNFWQRTPLKKIYFLKMLSHVVNTSFVEKCWSTYSFIHNVKRNCNNENRAESLVYVHYNLKLLTHYCERARSNRAYITWDNNPEEDNLEDGALHLEQLEAEILDDEDEAVATTSTAMPPPSTSKAQVAPALPPPPSAALRGGHVPFDSGHRSQPL